MRVFIKVGFLLSGYVILWFQQCGRDEINVSCTEMCLKSQSGLWAAHQPLKQEDKQSHPGTCRCNDLPIPLSSVPPDSSQVE